MRASGRMAAAALAILAISCGCTRKVAMPRDGATVDDAAGILHGNDVASITRRSGIVRETTGHEFALRVLTSFGKDRHAIIQALKDGVDPGVRNDGMLMIVAADDRKVVFDVSPALASRMRPDATVRIARWMTPDLQIGDMRAAVVAGSQAALDAMEAATGDDAGQTDPDDTEAETRPPARP